MDVIKSMKEIIFSESKTKISRAWPFVLFVYFYFYFIYFLLKKSSFDVKAIRERQCG